MLERDLGRREYRVLQAGFPEGHFACRSAEYRQTHAHGQSLESSPTSGGLIDAGRVFGDWGNVSGLVGIPEECEARDAASDLH